LAGVILNIIHEFVYTRTTVYIFARDEARDKLGVWYGGFSLMSRLY
jgi:hypothetical protein